MRDVTAVLADIGIREYSRDELARMGDKYKTALLEGLNGNSELPMYPSYLSPVDPHKVPEGKTALVIELGGSNIYGGIVTKMHDEIVVVHYHRAPLPTRTFESAKQFYEIVGDILSPLLEEAKPDAIGINYSFPGKSIQQPVGNEAIVTGLTKEFVIPGISDLPVGESVRKYIGAKYSYLLNLPTVAMNDTVAVLLCIGAPVGGVVATGFNLAVATPKGIANSESGGFKGVPDTEASKQVDAASGRPGHNPAEKHISGLYLPEYFRIAIEKLRAEGHDVLMPESVDAAAMSNFIEREPVNKYEELDSMLSKLLITQSAQIVGQMVATAIDTFHPDLDGEIEIPIEGSLFWRAPGYADRAMKTANEALRGGKIMRFANISHAGRVGAGVAALGTLLQK